MSYIESMKLIRLILGGVILFFDRVFSPTPVMRSPAEQARVDEAAQSFELYQLNACPFCVKVRRTMKRLAIPIVLREIGDDATAHAELMAGGMIDQVPCLRVTDSLGKVTWLYESTAIVEFLENRFGSAQETFVGPKSNV